MAEARTLVPGTAAGVALVLDEPLSFWGGLDPATGTLIDVHHARHGALLAGRVLVMPAGRGSSSSSYVLAEAIRAGTAPAAIVLAEADPIVALGAIVARELYGTRTPIVQVAADVFAAIRDGSSVRVIASTDAASITTEGSEHPG